MHTALYLLGFAALATGMQSTVKSDYHNGELRYSLSNGVLKISGEVTDPEVPFSGEIRLPHLSKTLTVSIPALQAFLMPSTSVNAKCVREQNTMAVGVALTGAAVTLQCPWVDAEWFISINIPGVRSKAKSVGIGLEIRVSDSVSAVTFPAPPPKSLTVYYLKVALCVVAIVTISVVTGIACAMVQKRRADNIEMAERVRELESRWMGYHRMAEVEPQQAAPQQVYMCQHGRLHSVPLPTLQQPLFLE